MLHFLKKALYFFNFLLAVIQNTQAQTLIAGWDFQTTNNGGMALLAAPNTANQDVANFGNGTLYLNGNAGSSNWISASSGNQLTSFSGSALNAGTGFATSTTAPACLTLLNSTANGKSIVFAFSMNNYSNLQVSYATQGTATGFTSQQWDYSSDAINWLPVQTVTSIPTSYAIKQLPVITGLNNVQNAYLRVTFNGASSSTGNNRIDNVQLSASLSTPQITSANLSATVGVPFSYFIQANHSPSGYAALNLPPGLSINTLSGEISGIPSVAQSATPFTVSASNSSGSGNGQLTLTVAKGIQLLNFTPVSSKTFGDPSFVLHAIGGASGNPILFSSSTPSLLSITDSLATIFGAGTVTITASQAGNANYFPAADTSQLVFISKAAQLINFPAIPTRYVNDAPFTINASGGSSGMPLNFQSSNPAVATVQGNTVTLQLTASQNGNANYFAAADVIQTLVVNKIPQTINFGSLPSKLITDPPFALNATGGASGNSVLFSISDTTIALVNGNIVTLHGIGICTITASQAGNNQFEAAPDVTQILVVNSSGSLVTYSFGTLASPTPFPTLGIPFPNVAFSAISAGNNANTSQTTLNLSATSASTNSGSSGEINAGITARNRNWQPDSSAFFELTLTPNAGYLLTLNSLNFNTRSTSTGPTTLDIRTSLNNYSSTAGNITVNANSTWTNVTPSISGIASSSPVTLRIYGYVTGGSGSIGTGSSPNNWRIDDIKLNLSAQVITSCNLSFTLSATPINCNGGLSTITCTALNGNGTLHYQLNNNPYQLSNQFTGISAGSYTISVSDALGCSSTSIIQLNQPAAQLVSTTDINTCAGIPVTLTGFPAGGSFSIANPYSGPSTPFTYSYTDSSGCTTQSTIAHVTVTPCAALNLKLFIQGYYIGSGLMNPVLYNEGVSNDQTICDQIIVELHDANSFTLVATTNTTLFTDGTAHVSFPNLSGLFYIVVKHRNALQTWSAQPVAFGNGNVTYDFSTSVTAAYGNNSIAVEPGIWAFYSGDVVSDENIDLLDMAPIESDVELFNYGYFATDLNGDGNIDLLDFSSIEENTNLFIYSIHPSFIVFPETFESGAKTTYSIADVTLTTGSWNFDDALIGNSNADHKSGAACARIENTGKLTMNFDVAIDTVLISISHARYGTDSNSTWALFISSNSGLTWAQYGNTVNTTSAALQTTSFLIQQNGSIRLQIRKLSGGRLNIDDINIQAYSGSTNTTIDNDPLALGNPSNAVTDLSFPDNYLLIKQQFDLAYNESKGTAAWVAWHLDQNDLGTTPRCDCFAEDMQLPATFYRATASSYSGSGFDRGHQVPSSQRNNSITNNAVTFLMSNMLPQSPNLNQITWSGLEQYCVTLANNGYELYTYSGGYGSGGTGSNGGITNTIAGGQINVPSHCWKIVLALPVGTNDITRINSNTRVIAVDMPNTQSVNTHTWGYYRTSVDAIETATGFDFLSNLPNALQTILESAVDNGPTN